MPWITPFDPNRFNEISAGVKPLRWPRPNTLRTNALYRMAIGCGLPDARPVRFLFKIAPYIPVLDWFWGWVDLEVIDEN
ncbi:unnamed protein product, partial [marine sediment metagenome]